MEHSFCAALKKFWSGILHLIEGGRGSSAPSTLSVVEMGVGDLDSGSCAKYLQDFFISTIPLPTRKQSLGNMRWVLLSVGLRSPRQLKQSSIARS